MKRYGLTLAEILITLGVVGVVAAMTLPTLIKNYQKHTTVNQLKKAYTEIAQAIKLAEVDNGEIKYWNLDAPAKEFAKTYLIPYLKNVEFVSASSLNKNIQYKYLNGESDNMGMTSGQAIKLANGTFVFIDSWRPGNNSFRTIYIDINGLKKPNTIGKDVFAFQIFSKSNNFTGYGIQLSRSDLVSKSAQACNNKSSLQAGLACSSLIMQDGWKIESDYPW